MKAVDRPDARAAKEGKSVQEVISVVNQVKDSSGVVFAVQDLKYLRRGGRVGHVMGFLASTLRLILVMELRGGPIKPVERVRTEKHFIPRLLDLAEDRIRRVRPLRLAVVHTDPEARAWQLMKEARERFRRDELHVSRLAPVLGIHAGLDAFGLAYSCGA